MIRKRTMLVVLLGLVLGLVACAPAATPTPTPTKPPAAPPTKAAESTKPAAATPTTAPAATVTPKPATLKFGSLGSVTGAGVFIGIDKGYFKEQGITVEVNNFRQTAELIAPLGTGQLDYISMPLSIALLAAADRGVDMKIVADSGQALPKWDFMWLNLRKDLSDSGQVKTPADLKGTKIAISAAGTLADMGVQMALEKAGLKATDAEIVALPFAEHAAAFQNKAISANFGTEPFIATGTAQGFSVKWIPVSQFFDGRAQASTIIYGSGLIKDKDLGQRWMIAYLKAVRDYLKAFTTKEGRDEVVNILVKYSTVKDPKLYDVMEMPYLDPNGTPDKKSMDVQYKWYVDKALYTGKQTFNEILDLSYVEYAAQKLGKQ